MRILKFDEFETTNESLPRKKSVEQLKRVIDQSKKTDIGNRISNMNKQGANIQWIKNSLEGGVETLEDWEEENKKFVSSWNLKGMIDPYGK